MALHPRGPNMKKAQFKKKISAATRAKNLFHEALYPNCEIHGSWFFDSAKKSMGYPVTAIHETTSSLQHCKQHKLYTSTGGKKSDFRCMVSCKCFMLY